MCGEGRGSTRLCTPPVCATAILCSEDDIAVAILRLLELEKAVVEGAGATGLAACLTGALNQQLQGKK